MENKLTTEEHINQKVAISFKAFVARDDANATWQRVPDEQTKANEKGSTYRTGWEYVEFAKAACEELLVKPNGDKRTVLEVILVFGKKSDFFSKSTLNSLIVTESHQTGHKGKQKDHFCEAFYREISKPPASRITEGPLCPMILLSDLPVIEDANNSLSANNETLDPRIGFLDSSIWHRAISLKKGITDTSDDFPKRFKALCEELLQNHQWRLYDTISARESLEFQCRLLHNSYLIGLEGGHASAVTPFRFHSETTKKEEADTISAEFGKLTWSVTMIDDYVNIPINTFNGTKKESPGQKSISKGMLISYLLNSPYRIITILNQQEQEEAPLLDWIEEGVKLMTESNPEKLADIFILDYYLGIREQLNKPPKYLFGPEVIERAMTKSYERLSNQKLWVFPIAVFDNAFLGHLTFAGNQHNHTSLEMANPVDPITMPHRFRYEFYQFLQHNKDARKVHLGETLRELNTQIIDKKIRERHKNAYPEILESLYRIQQLKQFRDNFPADDLNRLQKTNSSVSRESFFGVSYLNSFSTNGELEQICHQVQHLTHLIAFGSRQDLGKAMMEVMRLRDLQQVLVKAKEKEISEPLEYWLREISAYLQKL